MWSSSMRRRRPIISIGCETRISTSSSPEATRIGHEGNARAALLSIGVISMPSLLGIDSGLTVTKAVIFDVDGTQLAVARRRVTQFMPKARHIERDMDELWNATADVIAEAISLS